MSDNRGDREAISRILNEQIRGFEGETGWRVTPEARAVLQALLTSVLTDQVGLIGTPQRQGLFGFDDQVRRRNVALTAARGVGGLLAELRGIGAPMAEFAANQTGQGRAAVQEIGAVFLVQHIATWSLVKNCTSWPQ